jgi:hypothetical protein
VVPRFFYRGLNILLEGEIDQRKYNHRTSDDDGGGQKDKERGDGQVTKHFLKVDAPEKIHWAAIGDPRLVQKPYGAILRRARKEPVLS